MPPPYAVVLDDARLMTPSVRTLSAKELNRAVLARQLLLGRKRVPLPRALELMGGLQAQYSPAMYVGLWSRVEGLARDDVTRALERRIVVQGTLLRSTIHLVSAADYWPFAIATRQERQRWSLKALRQVASESEIEAAGARVAERLKQGTATRAELEEVAGKRLVNAVGSWVDMVRVPPSGTWERRRADLFGLAQDWLETSGPADHGVQATPAVVDAARTHVVGRYLGGFGPARASEVADWAGLKVKVVQALLDSMRLRRFRAEDGTDLFDLPRAPLPHTSTPAPVRFLPVWDATLLVHARRTGILPEEFRPLVFNVKTPHSVPTFLVDGAVAGSWRYERGKVRLDPFERLAASTLRDLEAESRRLAAFHA